MNTLEFVIFARRGKLAPIERCTRQWWEWPRGEHSAKPEAFLDIVESVSPGPRIELFSRRARLGWSVWGNESLGQLDLLDCEGCADLFCQTCRDEAVAR